MPKDTSWRPDYDKVKDIMRPYNEKEDDAPQPDDGAPAPEEGERDWRAKVAEEDRQQHRTEARSRRRIGLSLGRKPGPDKKKKKRGAGLARACQLHAAAQIAPFAVILLLAPFISGPGGFCLLVLLLAAPATAAALLLRPLGKRAWLLRALIPLLPVEAHFALRYFSWNPGTALVLVSAFALGGALYYIFGVRGKGPDKDTPKPAAGSARLELEVRGRRQARRDRSDDDRQAAKGHSRRLLLFAVPLLSVSLLAPALLGLGMQLRRPAPNVIEEGGVEAQSFTDDMLMTRRMNGAYEHLQAVAWSEMDRQGKLAALQALLDVEIDRMVIMRSDLGIKPLDPRDPEALKEIRRFDLRDPTVLAASNGGGHTGVSAALLSGDSKAEQRVRAMCHLAYHLMQLTISGDINMLHFEEEAKAHEDARYKAHVYSWDNREAEVDHAG